MFSRYNPRYRECRDQLATIVVCLLIMTVTIEVAGSSIRYTEVPLFSALLLLALTSGRLDVERRVWERSADGRRYAANMRSEMWPNQRRVELRRVMDRIVSWMSADKDNARTEDDPSWRDQT